VKFDFADGVEVDLIAYDELLSDDGLFNDRFIIKTQSACVYGSDLAQKIPPFRADTWTASHFHRNLKQVLVYAKKDLSGDPDAEDIKGCCRWVMKRIVRAGFVLVMDKEQVFTRDLYPSYEDAPVIHSAASAMTAARWIRPTRPPGPLMQMAISRPRSIGR
jgi:uncharacterized protein